MNIFIFIGGAVLLLAIIITAVILLNKYLSHEEYRDYPIAENYMPQFTNGFSEGDVVGFIKGVYRDGVIIRPTDVDYLRRLKDDKPVKIENQIIWANPWQIEFIPAGSLSGERNKVKIFPPTPEDVPYKLQQTPYGQMLMKMIAERKAMQTTVEVVRSERNVEDRMLKETVGKELVSTRMQENDTITKDMLKRFTENASKALGGTYPHSPGGNY